MNIAQLVVFVQDPHSIDFVHQSSRQIKRPQALQEIQTCNGKGCLEYCSSDLQMSVVLHAFVT